MRVRSAQMKGEEVNPEDLMLSRESLDQETHQRTQKSSTQQGKKDQAGSQPDHQPIPTALRPIVEQKEGRNFSEEEESTEHRPRTARGRIWYDFFDQRFGPVCVLVLWFFTSNSDVAAFFAPSPDECHSLAPHMAQIMPAVEDFIEKFLSVPKWAKGALHGAVVNSESVVSIGLITMAYLDRIGALTKLHPYFTGTAVRMNNESSRHTSPVQPQSDGQYSPEDLASFGVGAQYRSG